MLNTLSRTHEQFEKKIQDYMRLADIQSSRGLIDKAIEVNTSALKFCKDRDQDCKADLEAQKAKLIEMKLKQSIERIEKGCHVIFNSSNIHSCQKNFKISQFEICVALVVITFYLNDSLVF